MAVLSSAEPVEQLFHAWRKSRSAAAFRELVGGTLPQVYRVARRLLVRHEDAEDVAQTVYAKLSALTAPPQSLRGWSVVIALALLAHVLGQGLIAYALAHLSTALSAAGLLVQPVAAAIFAWMLLDEPFGLRQAVGGVTVLAGIVLCRLATPTGPPA